MKFAIDTKTYSAMAVFSYVTGQLYIHANRELEISINDNMMNVTDGEHTWHVSVSIFKDVVVQFDSPPDEVIVHGSIWNVYAVDPNNDGENDWLWSACENLCEKINAAPAPIFWWRRLLNSLWPF